MPIEEKKGITVKIDAELHAQVKAYIEANGLTMAEFVTRALDNELHPKRQIGGNTMENMKTLAFQVPESLFQQIKEYLHRNHMTQKQFVIGLIEAELNRDLEQRHESAEVQELSSEQDESDETVQEDVVTEEDGALDESETDELDEVETEDDEPNEAESEDDSLDEVEADDDLDEGESEENEFDENETEEGEIDESEDEEFGLNM